jgi:hypothetical protein
VIVGGGKPAFRAAFDGISNSLRHAVSAPSNPLAVSDTRRSLRN